VNTPLSPSLSRTGLKKEKNIFSCYKLIKYIISVMNCGVNEEAQPGDAFNPDNRGVFSLPGELRSIERKTSNFRYGRLPRRKQRGMGLLKRFKRET
jgi:hypothetical protein